MGYSYQDAGVSVERNDEFAKFIRQKLRLPDWVVREPTGYAAILKFTQPPIVVTADGVGSKLSLHVERGRWTDAARDLVAMNYNDVLCVGGRPMAFVDYLGVHSIEEQHMDFVAALISELESVGMALVAGETAELPSVYSREEWDVAGFCVGILERRLPVETVTEGDVLIGLPASGFHSNGWSLIRRIIECERINIDELDFDILVGTRIYVDVPKSFNYVKGIAHVTGGGILRALKRLLREKGCDVQLRPPRYIEWVLNYVDFSEAVRTFNMGYGMVLVTSPDNVSRVTELLGGVVLGFVTKGEVHIETGN